MAGTRQRLAEEGAIAIGRYTLQARYCNAQGKLDGLRKRQEPQDINCADRAVEAADEPPSENAAMVCQNFGKPGRSITIITHRAGENVAMVFESSGRSS